MPHLVLLLASKGTTKERNGDVLTLLEFNETDGVCKAYKNRKPQEVGFVNR